MKNEVNNIQTEGYNGERTVYVIILMVSFCGPSIDLMAYNSSKVRDESSGLGRIMNDFNLGKQF